MVSKWLVLHVLSVLYRDRVCERRVGVWEGGRGDQGRARTMVWPGNTLHSPVMLQQGLSVQALSFVQYEWACGQRGGGGRGAGRVPRRSVASMFVNSAMEGEEAAPPAEPLRRKAATEATINMSRKGATRRRKVSLGSPAGAMGRAAEACRGECGTREMGLLTGRRSGAGQAPGTPSPPPVPRGTVPAWGGNVWRGEAG